MGRVAAILRLRCPECREGRLFRTLMSMHNQCPVCGTEFERGEQGYFVGAMYVAFALSLPPYLALFFAFLKYTDWSSERLLLGAAAAMLPLVPGIYRYSRVVWVHLDRFLDPVGRR